MKLARLNTLKPAASNLRLTLSVTLKILARVMSATQLPGPTKLLRPRLPTQPRQGWLNNGTAGCPDPAWHGKAVTPGPCGMALPELHQPLAHWLRDWLPKVARLELGRSLAA